VVRDMKLVQWSLKRQLTIRCQLFNRFFIPLQIQLGADLVLTGEQRCLVSMPEHEWLLRKK
jgi:hypothetical protein